MKVNITHKKYNDNVEVKVVRPDVWSVDHTLAQVILPLLLEFKTQGNGVPNDFINVIGSDMDNNYCFDFIKEDHSVIFDKGVEKWEETIDKMIWSFYQIVEGNYVQLYSHGEASYRWDKCADVTILNPLTNKKEETYKLVDENPEAHWLDVSGQRMHEDRINEGFALFGKYFRNLWT